MELIQAARKHSIQRLNKLVQATSNIFKMEECDKVFFHFKLGPLTKKLRIAYIMNHVRVCGGAKIILEHTNQLVKRGHEVFIVCKENKPDWMEIKAEYIRADRQKSIIESIPEVDIIVCTTIDQVPECYLMGTTPIIMFEQGDVYIYEFDKVDPASHQYYRNIWKFPVPIIGVSKILTDTLNKNFGRNGKILHNALDKTKFYPKAPHLLSSKKTRILFVGQEENTFKGIKVIRQALDIVRKTGHDFEQVWVTQTAPKSNFDGTLVINPSQEELGDVYRSSDIFISGSFYESFPLPPLEAMTCGCTVVSTDNAGIKEYAVDGENCLLGKIGNPESLAEQIIALIDSPEKREYLIKRGYETADQFSWEKIVLELEQYLCGAIDVWEHQKQETKLQTLRIEKLPRGLSREQANEHIDVIQQQMKEEWCLWLIEDETIEEKSVDHIRRILSHKLDLHYAIQVIYPEDVPDHPLVRLENRLLPKKQKVNNSINDLIVIPVTINNASEGYFLPVWLDNVRKKYNKHEFYGIISFLQSNFSNLTSYEQLIAVKWTVLCLIEMEQYSEAINVLNDALKLGNAYSDFLYLYGRICLIIGKYRDAQLAFELVQVGGTAIPYGDAFLNLAEYSQLYSKF